MEELDIAAVTRRSIRGIFALVTRTFFIQIISFVANFLLTIYLSPSIFGVFFVVTAVIAFLSYFSDIGLAGALIQKKESLTQEDLQTTFTVQQVLVGTLVVIGILSSNIVGNFYHLDTSGVFLFQALVISFFLSSLKTIPSILLERDLLFEKLVIPQIVETLFFNLVVLFCAVKGLGVTSFSFAVLARGLSGLIAIYILSPWKIRFGFSSKVLRKLLSFGIPFQLNSLLALVKDDLLIAYIGKILPLSQVGYIGFAQKWAFTPLRLIMDNIIRITFPSFSRLQQDKKHLGVALEKSLFALALLIFPSIVGLSLLFPLFIHIVPKYQKWDPALLSLTFFAFNAGFSSVSTPLTNALSAIGKIQITLFLMVFWTINTWVLTPLFIFYFGFNGFAMAAATISLSVFLVIFITKQHISFSLAKSILHPLVASIVMGVVLYYLLHMLPASLLSFFILIIAGVVAYFSLMILLARRQLKEDFAVIRRQFKK